MSTSQEEKQVESEQQAEKKDTEELAEDPMELLFFNNKEASRSDLPAKKPETSEDEAEEKEGEKSEE